MTMITAATDIAIEARALSKQFGRTIAVNEVDLAIPRAKIYGFLGPNGSGKSTTIRLLCGLLAPSSGSVEVLGLRIPEQAERLRQKIGYMTQKFSLYEDLSVAENLNFVARIYGLSASARRERIQENVDKYYLGDLLAQRAGTLSGGQKQRLALAAVTLHEPQLLLLDEPTSAVDPQSRRDFWDSLFELAEQGTTILVSTHFMDEAERCHRLAILDSGRIVAEGEPRSLAADVRDPVIEVTTESPRILRAALADIDWIHSVTQLGSRLRVMVPESVPNAIERLEELMAAGSVVGHAKTASANLEDVFVLATSKKISSSVPEAA